MLSAIWAAARSASPAVRQAVFSRSARAAASWPKYSEDTVFVCQAVFLPQRIIWIKRLVFFHHGPRDMQQLVPPFEAAFQARMAVWRMDGKPRIARRFTVYQNCPLPTPEDRLLFILTYLKTYALQVVHGRLFGMVQGKANQWIHVLLPVLLAALRALGDAPARSLTALAQRLGVSETDVATIVTPLTEDSAPMATAPAAVPVSPLLPMTARNGVSSAPRTRLNRRGVIAARKRTTQ